MYIKFDATYTVRIIVDFTFIKMFNHPISDCIVDIR